MLLLYLQQNVKTINRNLPRDESLAPEKVCTVLFGRGRLEITMNVTRLVACANIAQATRVRALQNLRPLAGNRMQQLMKSFKNINILIKVKLFCWKKFMFQKSFYLKKDCHLKEKKNS